MTHVGDDAVMVKHLLAAWWDSGGGLEVLMAIASILPNVCSVLFLPRKKASLPDQIDIDPKVVLGAYIVNVAEQLSESVAVSDKIEILVRKVVVQSINRSKEGQHWGVVTHL